MSIKTLGIIIFKILKEAEEIQQSFTKLKDYTNVLELL